MKTTVLKRLVRVIIQKILLINKQKTTELKWFESWIPQEALKKKKQTTPKTTNTQFLVASLQRSLQHKTESFEKKPAARLVSLPSCSEQVKWKNSRVLCFFPWGRKGGGYMLPLSQARRSSCPSSPQGAPLKQTSRIPVLWMFYKYVSKHKWHFKKGNNVTFLHITNLKCLFHGSFTTSFLPSHLLLPP